MKQDQLFLLKPGFVDDGKVYYCPYCAEVAGVLSFYPELKKHIVIHWVDFQRPRHELMDLLDEKNQGCPVLVLHSVLDDLPKSITVQQANGHAFITDTRDMGAYFAARYGTGQPH